MIIRGYAGDILALQPVAPGTVSTQPYVAVPVDVAPQPPQLIAPITSPGDVRPLTLVAPISAPTREESLREELLRQEQEEFARKQAAADQQISYDEQVMKSDATSLERAVRAEQEMVKQIAQEAQAQAIALQQPQPGGMLMPDGSVCYGDHCEALRQVMLSGGTALPPLPSTPVQSSGLAPYTPAPPKAPPADIMPGETGPGYEPIQTPSFLPVPGPAPVTTPSSGFPWWLLAVGVGAYLLLKK